MGVSKMDKFSNSLKTISKDYYGLNYYNSEEVDVASKVIINKSPFRYYGDHLSHEVDNFEVECTQYFGVKYAHTVNSATGGLSCALHALDVSIGDEVIVPGYFWVAVANVSLIRGAIPVLCEVDESLNMDPLDLRKKITPKTKCVIVIHMDGVPAAIEEIRDICSEHNIKILEDFSQCIGGEINGKKIGSFGDIAVASMQVNKIITAGEGGIVLMDNEDYYYKIVAKSDFGFQRNQDQILNDRNNKYLTYGEGRRCSEISAAILRVQLHKLPEIIQNMMQTKTYIKQNLGNIAPIRFRKITYPGCEIGTTLMFTFPDSKVTDRFLQIYHDKFQDDDLKLCRLSDFGYHVYYNCTNLTEKKEVLPGGFPWTYIEEDNYHYRKGTLPVTDDLLSRTIIMKLPARLNSEQREAVTKALLYIINLL